MKNPLEPYREQIVREAIEGATNPRKLPNVFFKSNSMAHKDSKYFTFDFQAYLEDKRLIDASDIGVAQRLSMTLRLDEIKITTTLHSREDVWALMELLKSITPCFKES